MTSPAVTIEPQASVAEAARRMERERVKRLPVVDTVNTLVGIVSRRDLLRIYRRADDDIRAEALDHVFREWFQAGPPDVSVNVHEGVVTLSGVLERRRQVELAARLAHAIDGVMDVENRLAYRIDDALHPSGHSATTGRS